MDNYPMMSASELERAPWMERHVPEKVFEVTCSQSLSKTVNVVTSNYCPIVEHEPYNGMHEEYDDTSDTDWGEEFHCNDYHTPLQLVELFGKFLEEQVSNGVVFRSPAFTDRLIEECKNWNEDETEYIKE